MYNLYYIIKLFFVNIYLHFKIKNEYINTHKIKLNYFTTYSPEGAQVVFKLNGTLEIPTTRGLLVKQVG